MYKIDDAVFNKSVEQLFSELTKRQSEERFDSTEISFSSGYLLEEEGYKKYLFEQSQSLLNVDSWTHDMIGTGQIRDYILLVVNQKMPGESRPHNLLGWRERIDINNCFTYHLEESEKLFFGLYKNELPDEIVFKSLEELWGRRYSIIAFFFFIKDRCTYLPIKPEIFKERFLKIGIATDCVNSCSWNNYLEFLEMIHDVQNRLIAPFKGEVDLLDAHSFVWMVWHIEEDVPSEAVRDMTSEDERTTVVVTHGKEGAKKQYYTTRYERDPKKRAEALRIHGLTCAVCEMDFESVYGELGKGYIEVHHVKPLYSLEGESEVNPETDLVCLCSNCHSMIHHKKNYIMSVEELKEIYQSRKTK